MAAPNCDCQLPCETKVATGFNKPENKGRVYYVCPLGKDNGCGFFKFQDECAPGGEPARVVARARPMNAALAEDPRMATPLKPVNRSRPPARDATASSRSSSASVHSDEGGMRLALRTIIANQDEMFHTLDEIMEKLVHVGATAPPSSNPRHFTVSVPARGQEEVDEGSDDERPIVKRRHHRDDPFGDRFNQ